MTLFSQLWPPVVVLLAALTLGLFARALIDTLRRIATALEDLELVEAAEPDAAPAEQVIAAMDHTGPDGEPVWFRGRGPHDRRHYS